MRYFKVYIDKRLVGVEPIVTVVAMQDKATDAECAAVCQHRLDMLMCEELDAGWPEVQTSCCDWHELSASAYQQMKAIARAEARV